MYSDNKIALIICQKNDPELKKLRPFLPCSYWARSIHPCYCYSLKNMKVNAKFIYIVDNQNIPQFFDDILGHASRTNSLTFGLKSKKQYLAKMVLWRRWERDTKQILPQNLPQRRWERETTFEWYHEDGRKAYHQMYNQEYNKPATARAFNKFSTSRVLPEALQCGCGTTHKSDTSYQKHINLVLCYSRGFCSTQKKTFYRKSGWFIIKSENREKSLGQVGEFIERYKLYSINIDFQKVVAAKQLTETFHACWHFIYKSKENDKQLFSCKTKERTQSQSLKI